MNNIEDVRIFLGLSNLKVFKLTKDIWSVADIRTNKGYIGGFIGIFGNLGLFTLKLFIALISGSVAIFADAFHTLSDILTSITVVVGFYFSSKAPDEKHPYGHGRAEDVAALIIAIALIFTATYVLYDSWIRMMNMKHLEVTNWVILVVVFTIIAKEAMARVVYKMGKDISSLALEADAWHHRSDALTSAGVVVALVLERVGIYAADAFMGFIIGIMLIYLGINYSYKSINSLIGLHNEELLEKIKEEVSKIEGVVNPHNIKIHNYGTRMYISLHIELAEDMKVSNAHRISEKVEETIKNLCEYECNVDVHIDILGCGD